MIAPDKIIISYQLPEESKIQTEQINPFPIVASGKLSLLHKAFEESIPSEIENFMQLRDNEGRSLLHFASFLDLQNLSLYLLSFGANPYVVDDDGQNCFHPISYKGNIGVALIIMNYKRHELKKSLFETLT